MVADLFTSGMNLFTGMTSRQEISVGLMFLLFNGYVLLEAAALGAFYVSTRPRRGRPNTASLWYLVAAFWVMWSFVSCVWASPAEKAFVDADNPDVARQNDLFNLHADRFQKVIMGICFSLLGVVCMAIGAALSRKQRRVAEQRLLFEGA